MTKGMILGELYDLEYDELATVWNRYCDKNQYNEDRVYDMGEFNEIAKDWAPLEIADKTKGDFRVMDDYFTISIWDECESASDPQDLIEIDELAEYICENMDDFTDYIKVEEE